MLRVRMRAPRTYQDDFGNERPLEVGREYNLPDPVAHALIATTAALAVAADPEPAKQPATAAPGASTSETGSQPVSAAVAQPERPAAPATTEPAAAPLGHGRPIRRGAR